MKNIDYKPKIGDLLFFDASDGPMFGMIVDTQGNVNFPYRVQWVNGGKTIETKNDYRDICYHRSVYLNLRKKNGLQ